VKSTPNRGAYLSLRRREYCDRPAYSGKPALSGAASSSTSVILIEA
jgi:hypothetical protein